MTRSSIQKLLKSEGINTWIKKYKELLEKILDVKSDTTWFYFRSRTLNSANIQDEIKSEEVKHRLYLTVDAEYRSQIASRMIGKCTERKLPYEFKVYTNVAKKKTNQQSDTIVIYLSEDNQVVQYVNFINEILDEDKELKSHIHKASPHLGIIDEYIGYGFEPKLEVGQTSYSRLVQKATAGPNKKKMAIEIFSFLADKNNRMHYDACTPERMRVYKPSEWEEMKLENPERYEELLEIIKNGEATPEEYEAIRNALSRYFKRENMEVDEIYTLREKISKGLVKLYPQLPEDKYVWYRC